MSHQRDPFKEPRGEAERQLSQVALDLTALLGVDRFRTEFLGFLSNQDAAANGTLEPISDVLKRWTDNGRLLGLFMRVTTVKPENLYEHGELVLIDEEVTLYDSVEGAASEFRYRGRQSEELIASIVDSIESIPGSSNVRLDEALTDPIGEEHYAASVLADLNSPSGHFTVVVDWVMFRRGRYSAAIMTWSNGRRSDEVDLLRKLLDTKMIKSG
jgi:hypothetical protein